ncbi:MAG: shikimate dehydrogenase [Sporomusaceae bacterium]|nr:shikimate dehydrogenase [Sporomusaceae bacterium]
MEKFAFIVHPLTAKDFSRKFSFTKTWPDRWVEGMIKYIPPLKVSSIQGISSPYGQAEGWFIGCPLTARQMMELPEEVVLKKIIGAGKIAEKLGAEMLGLGAFTSIVGDAGITIAKNLTIPVTTGNSYTVAMALAGTREAAKKMGICLEEARVVILGATGSIGAACAQLLSREVSDLILVARDESRLEKLSGQILKSTGLAVQVTANTKAALKAADIIIAVTSSVESLIEPTDLKSGAVVCDVARPRNVAKAVASVRKDVLVIDGGIVKIPGEVDFGIDFGFPPGTAYACMAETILLCLEKYQKNFTLGRHISVKQIEWISAMAKKHHFRLAGLRSFDKPLTDQDIEKIRLQVQGDGGYLAKGIG